MTSDARTSGARPCERIRRCGGICELRAITEAHYPVAITQAYEATKWVAEHGAEIGVDGKRLALVGNSVGGNMVAAVALQAKQHKTPAIRYDVMLWPVTDAHFDDASYQQFANGYFLTRNMMKWFWDNYTTSDKDRNNILASPLRATEAQLAGLPPTLIQTANSTCCAMKVKPLDVSWMPPVYR